MPPWTNRQQYLREHEQELIRETNAAIEKVVAIEGRSSFYHLRLEHLPHDLNPSGHDKVKLYVEEHSDAPEWVDLSKGIVDKLRQADKWLRERERVDSDPGFHDATIDEVDEEAAYRCDLPEEFVERQWFSGHVDDSAIEPHDDKDRTLLTRVLRQIPETSRENTWGIGPITTISGSLINVDFMAEVWTHVNLRKLRETYWRGRYIVSDALLQDLSSRRFGEFLHGFLAGDFDEWFEEEFNIETTNGKFPSELFIRPGQRQLVKHWAFCQIEFWVDTSLCLLYLEEPSETDQQWMEKYHLDLAFEIVGERVEIVEHDTNFDESILDWETFEWRRRQPRAVPDPRPSRR